MHPGQWYPVSISLLYATSAEVSSSSEGPGSSYRGPWGKKQNPLLKGWGTGHLNQFLFYEMGKLKHRGVTCLGSKGVSADSGSDGRPCVWELMLWSSSCPLSRTAPLERPPAWLHYHEAAIKTKGGSDEVVSWQPQ